MKPVFVKTETTDFTMSRVQNSIETTFNQILQCPLLDGRQLTVAFEENKDQVISHGLGRTYIGFIPMNPNNFGFIKISDTLNNDKANKIILQSTGSLVTALWIF